MSLHTEDILVALAIGVAIAWLARRAWVRARARYRTGPCCGEGCGCVKPLLFGPKARPRRRQGADGDGRP